MMNTKMMLPYFLSLVVSVFFSCNAMVEDSLGHAISTNNRPQAIKFFKQQVKSQCTDHVFEYVIDGLKAAGGLKGVRYTFTENGFSVNFQKALLGIIEGKRKDDKGKHKKLCVVFAVIHQFIENQGGEDVAFTEEDMKGYFKTINWKETTEQNIVIKARD